MSIDSADLNEVTTAFKNLVAAGGHRVEEWIQGVGTHESEAEVIAYGDCLLCLMELQLRLGASGPKPSLEAARACTASGDVIEDNEDYVVEEDWV